MKGFWFKSILILLKFILVSINQTYGQKVLLSANGPGNTDEEINKKFAPGNDVIEVPEELEKHVFNFFVHVVPDNDRCLNFDRQRTEIKTYGGSPDNLKAVLGETVIYSWKFKLPQNFKVSKNFTHLHQIKSVGSIHSTSPMITLTARKSTPDRMELRCTSTTMQSTLKTALLDLFRDEWVKVTEVIKYDNFGSYYIKISRISDGMVLLKYNISAIDTWKDVSDLRDEQVRFDDFIIQELTPLSVLDYKSMSTKNKLKVNKSKMFVSIKNIPKNSYEEIELISENGKKIALNRLLQKNKIRLS